MTKLVFIEGVSGVGKSTMTDMLARELRGEGYAVKAFLEGDFKNPIDFYAAAYLSLVEYEGLCCRYSSAAGAIRTNTIAAGDARLVRYRHGESPLFEGELLRELAEREFCYQPSRLVPLREYTAVYRSVWTAFAASLDRTFDFILFDGTLLHHPINDMMKNYGVTEEKAAFHVACCLQALGQIKRYIFYLKTGDLAGTLQKARISRGQATLSDESIAFWQTRFACDLAVLSRIREEYQILDVSENGWDLARKQLQQKLTGHFG